MLYFALGSQKNKREQFWAMPLPFARLLRECPAEERTGHVFRLLTRNGLARSRKSSRIGASIHDMAKLAGISTGLDHKGRVRFCTAHDLRRSLLVRLAAKGAAPMTLRDVARHGSLETTARFYLTLDARRTAAELRKLDDGPEGNTSGNSGAVKAVSPG